MYQGKALVLKQLDHGIVELCFDLQGESVNKFNRMALEEFSAAIKELQVLCPKGLLVTSAKESFIVGADIGEFLGLFASPEAELAQWALHINQIFCAFEDLPFPTVVAINGFALGGGLECCLAADYRVMSTTAQIGLPEVKLGIFPGFGGTVRLPRVIGVDNAVEWIAAGEQHGAEKALKDGVVDAVVAPEKLRQSALSLVQQCFEGKFDFRKKRQEKLDPIQLPPLENMMSFQTCMALVAEKAGKNYPAPMAAVKTMQKHATLKRDQALEIETKEFAKIAKTPVAANLINLFLNDQALKKISSKLSKGVEPIKQAAVIGAGIMGGGIAYQSAYKGTPIIMKDIADAALTLGLNEASKLLSKRVSRNKMTVEQMGEVLGHIRPTLNYGDFAAVEMVIEAVVENPKVKKSVLAEVEKVTSKGTIIASNTSTISIDELASGLQHPENFLGMHFFNPVHVMPLVEVIRGTKTSADAVAKTVAYARAMGKTPIVVNDCPGFLVNRVLFPYLAGFNLLLKDGVDFQAIDKVMERFGWPMGPAYLLDVVGIDTGVHAAAVMADGFPERMRANFKDATTVLYENKRLGQKNGQGFYRYEMDKKGKPKKVVDENVYALLQPVTGKRTVLEDDVIIARMMIPMCLETVRCVEENIVASVVEADMALIMGLGFPPFRGGALKYMDDVGLAKFVELCDGFADLGPAYQVTSGLRERAQNNRAFYS